MRGSAPPSRASTMPMRSDHAAHAELRDRAGFGFPGATHVGEEALAGAASSSSELLAARAVVADRRRAHEHARALALRRARDRLRRAQRVDSTRLAGMRARRAGVRRPPKTGSPARCTTPAAPAAASAGNMRAVPPGQRCGGRERARGAGPARERPHRDAARARARASRRPPTSPRRARRRDGRARMRARSEAKPSEPSSLVRTPRRRPRSRAARSRAARSRAS